jgi:aldehyde dehydrogenase (NAD+)
VAERFKALRLGPGLEDPELGPLISEQQRERVQSYVERGKEGACLVFGGDVPRDEHLANGFFYLPTLFDQVRPEAVIAQEEIFGPCSVCLPSVTLGRPLPWRTGPGTAAMRPYGHTTLVRHIG